MKNQLFLLICILSLLHFQVFASTTPPASSSSPSSSTPASSSSQPSSSTPVSSSSQTSSTPSSTVSSTSSTVPITTTTTTTSSVQVFTTRISTRAFSGTAFTTGSLTTTTENSVTPTALTGECLCLNPPYSIVQTTTDLFVLNCISYLVNLANVAQVSSNSYCIPSNYDKRSDYDLKIGCKTEEAQNALLNLSPQGKDQMGITGDLVVYVPPVFSLSSFLHFNCIAYLFSFILFTLIF